MNRQKSQVRKKKHFPIPSFRVAAFRAYELLFRNAKIRKHFAKFTKRSDWEATILNRQKSQVRKKKHFPIPTFSFAAFRAYELLFHNLESSFVNLKLNNGNLESSFTNLKLYNANLESSFANLKLNNANLELSFSYFRYALDRL